VRHRNALDGASPFEGCREVIDAEMNRTFTHPDATTMRDLELLVPHAEILSGSDQATPDRSISLKTSIGQHHRSLGRYMMAVLTWRSALAQAEKTFEPGHPTVRTIRSNLTAVMGQFGDAL
jgi:hypothetical protein